METLDFHEWVEKYKPIMKRNEPCMFDVSSDFSEIDKACVWTDCSADGYNYIDSGTRFVNRNGYYITEIPVPEGEFFQIVLHEPDDDEPDNKEEQPNPT